MRHRAGIVRAMHPSAKASLYHELGQLIRSGTPFPKAVEKLARLRTFHFEPLGEVRKQLRFAHASGVCHHVPPILCAPTFGPRNRLRAHAVAETLGKAS